MKGYSSFLRLWAGQILSQSGAKMYQMAVVWWLVTHQTENPGLWVGAFMVTTALPAILLLKYITKLIESYPSRKVLVGCDLAAALLVGSVGYLLWKQAIPPPWLLIAGFLSATLQGTLDPTLNKSVAEVVPQEKIAKAAGLLASTQSVANFSGAILGTLLIVVLGVHGVCALAALGYLVSAICSAQTVFTPAVTGVASEAQTMRWNELTPFLKKVLLGFSWINFFGTPTLVVLPLYVRLTLGGDASLLARLESTLWLGLLGGSFLSPYLTFLKKPQHTATATLGLFGFFLVVAGSYASTLVYQISLAMGGMCIGINNVRFMTLFQERVPQVYKARFFAFAQALISFTFPIAYFLFGVLCDYLTPTTTCIVQGLGVLTVALSFLWIAEEEPNALFERLGISTSQS